MKQKERFDEKPKQEHTEPKHHRKAVIKGITVYESFRPESSELWTGQAAEHGKTLRKRDFIKKCSSLIFVSQLGKIQTG